MNKNIENYKKAVDNIQASDELINKTISKANEKTPSKRGNFFLYTLASLSACAAIMLVAINIFPMNRHEDGSPTSVVATVDNRVRQDIVVSDDLNGYIKHFKSQEELDKKIEEISGSLTQESKIVTDGVISNSATPKSSVSEDAVAESSESNSNTASNYSTTNVQVQGVDEADIIKTDGKNIYLVKNKTLYVLDRNLKETNKKSFGKAYLEELYITSDRIVVVASEDSDYIDSRTYGGYNTDAVIKVLDKNTLELTREVKLRGYTRDSRLIGDDLYFLTSLTIYHGENIKSYPQYEDSITGEGRKTLDCTDICYVEGYQSTNYINVCAFNIKDNEEANVASFFGMNTKIYCSENNMYFINNNYVNGDKKLEILKMRIDNSKMKFLSKATLPGEINDQFSLDEYNGYLRVATTEYSYNSGWFDTEKKMTNHLFVLDSNMDIVGQTEEFGINEKIRSVRFMGKVGYVVTFREIDPLFVMDLSDPTNPTIKGELKVPGYSAYLHPYDENHIIGIGYNTESNGYGGVMKTNMKMSMFDVSDLTNPKEMYTVDIGDGKYVSSPITYNHKTLLYDKERDLIGFPISYSGDGGFVIYKIEKDGFKKVVSKEKKSYYSDIKRIIYIEDTVYAFCSDEIAAFNLYSLEEVAEYDFEQLIEDYVIIE